MTTTGQTTDTERAILRTLNDAHAAICQATYPIPNGHEAHRHLFRALDALYEAVKAIEGDR